MNAETQQGTGQPNRPEAPLAELVDRLPDELAGPAFTHASWTTQRSDSYERLAFLGDSVLALAVTAYLYPRLEAERFGTIAATGSLQARLTNRTLPAPGTPAVASVSVAGVLYDVWDVNEEA